MNNKEIEILSTVNAVNIFNTPLYVPQYINYISVNADGTITGFDALPELSNGSWYIGEDCDDSLILGYITTKRDESSIKLFKYVNVVQHNDLTESIFEEVKIDQPTYKSVLIGTRTYLIKDTMKYIVIESTGEIFASETKPRQISSWSVEPTSEYIGTDYSLKDKETCFEV